MRWVYVVSVPEKYHAFRHEINRRRCWFFFFFFFFQWKKYFFLFGDSFIPYMEREREREDLAIVSNDIDCTSKWDRFIFEDYVSGCVGQFLWLLNLNLRCACVFTTKTHVWRETYIGIIGNIDDSTCRKSVYWFDGGISIIIFFSFRFYVDAIEWNIEMINQSDKYEEVHRQVILSNYTCIRRQNYHFE